MWQRNYFERVIRDEDELLHIREYIQYNPQQAHYHVGDDLSDAWVADSKSQKR